MKPKRTEALQFDCPFVAPVEVNNFLSSGVCGGVAAARLGGGLVELDPVRSHCQQDGVAACDALQNPATEGSNQGLACQSREAPRPF